MDIKIQLWFFDFVKRTSTSKETKCNVQAVSTDKLQSVESISKFIHVLITARPPKDDGRLYFQSVHISGGGPRSQIFLGGFPGLRFFGGGGGCSQVSDFFGGAQVSDFFWGGPPGLRFSGGGVPGLSKGKNFWHQIWLDTCSEWEKIFLSRDPLPSQ